MLHYKVFYKDSWLDWRVHKDENGNEEIKYLWKALEIADSYYDSKVIAFSENVVATKELGKMLVVHTSH